MRKIIAFMCFMPWLTTVLTMGIHWVAGASVQDAFTGVTMVTLLLSPLISLWVAFMAYCLGRSEAETQVGAKK